MTRHPDGEREQQTQQGETRGEVIISGLDTGPSDAERENLTPTEDHARFQPPEQHEPEDEDG